MIKLVYKDVDCHGNPIHCKIEYQDDEARVSEIWLGFIKILELAGYQAESFDYLINKMTEEGPLNSEWGIKDFLIDDTSIS